MYISRLGAIVRQHIPDYCFYADDTQIYVAASPDKIPHAIKTLEAHFVNVHAWLCSHCLKLNESKTEFILISSKKMVHYLQDIQLTIGNHKINLSKEVRNLGITMDCHAVMEQHVMILCCAAYGQLQVINRMKRHLDQQSLEIVIHALVSARLDCGNPMLAGVSQCLLVKVQSVQNVAAQILAGSPKYAHITPVPHSLH